MQICLASGFPTIGRNLLFADLKNNPSPKPKKKMDYLIIHFLVSKSTHIQRRLLLPNGFEVRKELFKYNETEV